ncbi:MAG: CDP-diacylglycerol--glycerol-3-phosphate 3-phosphatidyltransferase [Clostridia bacterium]
MNLPNKLSLLRIALIPVFAVVYLLDFAYAPLVAIGIFIIAALTDLLDGHIARKYNMVTNLGKLLDPIADKLLVGFALFLIAYSQMLEPKWICTIFGAVIIARELLISMVRQVAASKGVIVQANIYGKLKTVMQTIALPITMLLNMKTQLVAVSQVFYDVIYILAYSTLGLAVLLTIISGIVYLIQNKNVFAEA